MKKLILAASLLALTGCFTPQHRFEEDPGEYGLYVATTNIFTNSDLVVQQEGTGKVFPLKNTHSYAGDSLAFVVASLPPGRYHLASYNPDGRNNYPLSTANGWFDVQADCFNYGGYYDFEMGEDGLPVYKNVTTLQDITKLPGHYKDLAEHRDICAATMGHDSERLKAEDVAQALGEL